MKLINPQGGAGGTVLDAYANILLTGSTPSIVKASSNVTSITDRGVGLFTLNMDALASANYTATSMPINSPRFIYQDNSVTKTTTALPIKVATTADAGIDVSFYIMIAGA